MITLWGRNNSTNVKKVRWVLEELDLPYQQILAGLEFGLNHDADYLAMNPNGLVPLFAIWPRSTVKIACGWSRPPSALRGKNGWTGPTVRSRLPIGRC